MKNDKKICGIIAEYNPFHNGHKYQLDLIKQSYDAVVVVMSGSFTQRGDTAIIDKWSRAKTTLLCGADLVIELPTVFAMSTADRFAFGAVNLLNSLGCVDALSFGSECGDINTLTNAANSIINESPEQTAELRKLLKSGISYAAARETVFSSVIPEGLLNEPNNILAIEYIKHLTLLKSKIVPVTHKRAGSAYNSKQFDTPMASAAAIRANLNENEIINQMPDEAYRIFRESPKHLLSGLDTAAVYYIRQNGPESLTQALECSEGIENRIYEAARKFSTIQEITDTCSTKRYTKAKIRRIILCSLLGISGIMCRQVPEYARVLGATKKGQEILSQIKKNSPLKLITKAADFKEENEMFKKDILATDIWALATDENKSAGKDFTTSPVIL